MSEVTEITIDPDDLESLAEAIAAGVTTLELLDAWIGTGAEIVDDCLVLNDGKIYADDRNAEIEYDDLTPAEAAQEYVRDCDFDDVASTDWVTVYTYRKGVDESGEIVHIGEERHKIAIEPTEPDCIDDHSHHWATPHELLGGLEDNPGVWGNGGGVICHEVCLHCGCERITDTWAQDMSTGEQGLTSLEYKEGEYGSEVEAMAIQRAKDALGESQPDFTGGYDYYWVTDGRLLGANDDDLAEFGRNLLDDSDATFDGNVICDNMMSREAAYAYVESHTDADQLDRGDLIRVYIALHDSEPSDVLSDSDIWSVCCAYVD